MIIQVKPKHIKAGVAVDCERCPIALAIMEQVPNITQAQVSGEGVTLYDENYEVLHEFDLPRNATEFVWKFDENEPVKPFFFELVGVGIEP